MKWAAMTRKHGTGETVCKKGDPKKLNAGSCKILEGPLRRVA
jgi:hypothetical protein